jgi:putative PIN family toxin of toxin-antitoxin system
MQRIVIDTNLWISFIISRKVSLLDDLLLKNNIRLLFSEELLNEIYTTIHKPKLQKYFLKTSFDEMMDVFSPFLDFVEVKSKIEICRDPNDNFLLALAKDGSATHLITGDSDLLILKIFEKTKILTVNDYLKENTISEQ